MQRRNSKVYEVNRGLYPEGESTGDFEEGLSVLLGESPGGASYLRTGKHHTCPMRCEDEHLVEWSTESKRPAAVEV